MPRGSAYLTPGLLWSFCILNPCRVKAGDAPLERRRARDRPAIAGQQKAGEHLRRAREADEELNLVLGCSRQLAADVVLLAVLVGIVVARDIAVVGDLEVQGAGASA